MSEERFIRFHHVSHHSEPLPLSFVNSSCGLPQDSDLIDELSGRLFVLLQHGFASCYHTHRDPSMDHAFYLACISSIYRKCRLDLSQYFCFEFDRDVQYDSDDDLYS